MVQFCCSRLGFKDIYTLEKDSFGDLAHSVQEMGQMLVLKLNTP